MIWSRVGKSVLDLIEVCENFFAEVQKERENDFALLCFVATSFSHRTFICAAVTQSNQV